MKISKLNFKQLYPIYSKHLNNSQFVSLDFEFSGTTMHKHLVNTRFDDPFVRYHKLKENIKNFIPLQVGLCGINVNHERVNLHPMNFHIFPYVGENGDKKLTFDIGSINFLTNNSFDFNKTFYDGIRWISLYEYSQAQKEKTVRDIIKSKREKKHFPPEARLLTLSYYSKLKEFVDKFNNNNFGLNDTENYLEFEVTYIRKVLLEYFISNLNSLFKYDDKNILFDVEVSEVNINKTILKLKITNESLLLEKASSLTKDKDYKKISSWLYYQTLIMGEDNQEWIKILFNLIGEKTQNGPLTEEEKSQIIKILSLKQLTSTSTVDLKVLKLVANTILGLDRVDELYKIGFTKVILDLIKEKKPLIFHNGILDLMQLVDKFIQPLPEDFSEFKSIVNLHFPTIYDTKYLIENNCHLFSFFQDSSLENVSKKIVNDNLLGDLQISIGEENSSLYSEDYTNVFNKDNSSKAHEAGYDAMMTSCSFVYSFRELFKNVQMLSSKPYVDNALSIFKNKLLFSGLQTPCDLNPQNDIKPNRFDIYVLTDLPEIISTEEIKNSFKMHFNLSPQIYKLFGQNFAYAIFTSIKHKEIFDMLANKYQEDNKTTDLLGKLPLQGYDIQSQIMSYRKFMTNLKNTTQEPFNFDQINEN